MRVYVVNNQNQYSSGVELSTVPYNNNIPDVVNFKLTASNNCINAKWGYPDNIPDFDRVEVYRSIVPIIDYTKATKVYSGTGTICDIRELTNNQRYYIKVYVVDKFQEYSRGVELNAVPYYGNSEIYGYPNPWYPHDQAGPIRITHLDAGLGSVSIYTIAGELVKSFDSSDLKADPNGARCTDQNGAMCVEWNGFNDDGQRVASGNYTYVVDGVSRGMISIIW
jgi:hypothetical protein